MAASHLGVFPADNPRAPEPEPRWYLYLAWGYPPPGAQTFWMRFVDLLLGPQLWLLYVGITYRTGPTRWNEHEGAGIGLYLKVPKRWAQYTRQHELLDSRSYATRTEAERAENLLIDRLQPVGNTAGKGRAGKTWTAPAARKRLLPQQHRAVRYATGAVLLGHLYLTVSLPRLLTGHFPTGWAWLGWAALTATALGGARYWTTRHPIGWRTPRKADHGDDRHPRDQQQPARAARVRPAPRPRADSGDDRRRAADVRDAGGKYR